MEENERKPAGSRRLEILQQSLAKKQAAFDDKIQAHFDDVRSANGQPLNDKRNGQATMNRWERQNDSLRTLQKSIEKTEAAIEREQLKIDHVARTPIPEFLKPMLEAGEITQWRKYPNRFFVPGVEKARIIWYEKDQEFGYSHLEGVKGEQFAKFRDTYNHIRALHRQERQKGSPSAETAEPEKAAAPSAQTPENTAAPITPSEQVPAAGSVEPPEPHYSEKIIGRLAESHGWHKEDGKTASKTIEGSGGGMLNPEGRLKVYARFDDNGRYLSLVRGFDTLVDMDARGIRPEAAAALLDDCAQMLRYSDKPFDRGLIEMRLYGMNLYYSAQQSPEAAVEAREALLPPHHCTPEQFDKTARAVPSDTARRWEIRWPEISEYGYSHAFSDAATAAEAVRDVHYGQINNTLYLATGGVGGFAPVPEKMPTQEVLAHYPDLAKQYLPQLQSPEDKYQAARDAYVKQTVLLPPAQKSRRNLLESQMEALIKGLPEQTQMQARANFYISQVSGQMQQKADKPTLGQGEIEFDR